MKKLFTLFWGLLSALNIQAQSDFPIQFADKDGNIIDNEATLVLTEYESDAFGNIQMPTNLYVKNLTNESIQIGGIYNIQTLDNGIFQTCFPENCVAMSKTGTFETGSGSLGADGLKNMQTEWLPTENGKCVVAYQLVTYKKSSYNNDWIIDQYGPTITLDFTFDTTGTSSADSQMWWGYYTNGNMDFLGTGKAETFDCAIFIPANHDLVGASTIKAIRFYANTASNISDLKLWISKDQPSNIETIDYKQTVDIAVLKDGFNDIELDIPYVVNNQGIYVGYSFTIKEADYCIPTGGSYVQNSFYIRSSKSVSEWSVLSDFGALVLQILIEGGAYPECYATVDNFGPAVVELGQSVDVPIKITNGGKDAITSIAYTISSNGTTTEERTIQTDEIFYSGSAKVMIPFEADATEGTVAKTLTITKINGKDNTASNNTATGNLTTVANLMTWPRNVLIEEFTTEFCVFCPDAAEGLVEFMSSNPDLASRIAIACHHAGYYTDWLTINASEKYTWFYNDGGRAYAPAFMYDRFAWDDKTPVVSRGNYKDYVEARIAEESYACIELSTSFDNGKLNVTAYCGRGWDFSSTPIRITLFLTEDNIAAHSQAGASGSFTHQHVLRAVNDTWGSMLDWNDNWATYSYNFDLDSSWKTDNLKVIAFLSGYDSNDPTNCKVENTMVITAGESNYTAINPFRANGQEVKTTYYDLAGRQVTNPSNGLFIKSVSYQNGKTITSKVVLK